MEYQKISNQPSKFRTKNQIKFKTTMLKSSLCDYSNAYTLVKGTITVDDTSLQVLPQIILTKK